MSLPARRSPARDGRELDAAFFVLSPDTALFSELLAVDGVRLMEMKRALSCQRHLPELSRVTLLPGMLDLPRDTTATPTS